jgi:hypothetical protein
MPAKNNEIPSAEDISYVNWHTPPAMQEDHGGIAERILLLT